MNKRHGGKNISVALCTCNGERYLQEQLESIIYQTLPPAELIVCDDLSEDGTMSILKEFIKTAPFPVILERNKKRLGAVLNFSQAISLCKSDYVACCDQDDLWHPDKLELSILLMSEAEKQFGGNTPLMVHSDLTVIDHSGIVLTPSYMKMRRIRHYDHDSFKKLLVQNFVTGCTVMINRSLIEAAVPIPEGVYMHDWWLALVAAAIGSISFIDRPTVLYRQHDKNVIGTNYYISKVNLRRMLDIKVMEKEFAKIVRQTDILSSHLETMPCETDLSWLSEYLNAINTGKIKALHAVCRLNLKMQGLIRNIYFYLMLVRSGYLKYL